MVSRASPVPAKLTSITSTVAPGGARMTGSGMRRVRQWAASRRAGIRKALRGDTVWISHADPLARQVAATQAELAGMHAQIGALFAVMEQACAITGIPVDLPRDRRPDLRLIISEGEQAS